MTTAIEERDMLLKGSAPQPLEFYTRVKGPTEYLFCARGVSFADFAGLFNKDLFAGEALLFRVPPAILNPNYWEPLTKENEHAVLEKMGGLVTREDGARTLIWRSDQIARGRLLRDGLDVPVEMLPNHVFRTSGPGLLVLGEAGHGAPGRLEFAFFSKIPADAVTVAQNDVAQMRLSLPEERMVFSSADDQTLRAVFATRDHLRRAVNAIVRGWVFSLTRHHMAYLTDRVVDSLVRVADGLGLSATPERGFVNKLRTFEVHAQVGKTEWPVQLPAGHDPLVGDERLLIYYDRTSGIWAVAT